MERTDFYVISFENTHYAMTAQKILREKYACDHGHPHPAGSLPKLRHFGAVPPDVVSQEEAVSAARSLPFEPNMFQLYYAQGDKNNRHVEPVSLA